MSEPGITPVIDAERRHGSHLVRACLAMIVGVVALVATGTVAIGALLIVLGCLSAMAFMLHALSRQER